MHDFPYSDILDAPHHVSPDRPRMSMRGRAAQFSAFAALEGHGDVLQETARLTEARRDLDDSERERLDRRLRELAARLAERPAVVIEHFVADARKEGGAYVRTEGRLAKVSAATGELVLEGGVRIAIDDIADVQEAGE